MYQKMKQTYSVFQIHQLKIVIIYIAREDFPSLNLLGFI